MARRVFYVVVNGTNWAVKSDGKLLSNHYTQAAAIEGARTAAKAAWAAGQPSQVLIQGADGKWRTEWTYGDDPVKTPG